jgi:hypothetical protein
LEIRNQVFMGFKEIVLGIIFTMVGLAPYILEKRGYPMPTSVITFGGSVTIVALSYGLFVAISLLLGKVSYLANQNYSLATSASAVIAIAVASSLITWWVIGGVPPPRAYDYTKWQSDKNETISRRNYLNETVEIDGKLFDHCKFTNVTLMYHGLGATTFLEPQFVGSVALRTDNQAVKGFGILESFLRSAPNTSSFTLGEVDPSTGNIRIIETMKKNVKPEEKGEPPKP